MSGNASKLLGSSVIRKQLIALTGLVMVGFVLGHLSGNLLIFLGPDVFNAYAHALASLGGVLWVMRLGLIGAVLLHIVLVVKLVLENSAARGTAYEVNKSQGDRKFATMTMRYSGAMILLFICLHLYDFTFGDKTGEASIVAGLNNGESLELFGLVWNSFKQWWHSLLYILAVCSVGLHLTHAIESALQTFGFNHDRYTPIVKKISMAVGVIVALLFSSIPIYVLIAKVPFGV